MGGEQHIVDEAEVFAVECEVLQTRIGAIGDDQRRSSALAIIQPETVRRIHLTGFFAQAAPGADPAGVLVVLMDVVRAITIADVEAAIRREGHVCRPILGDARIDAGFEGITQLPHLLAFEGGFDDLGMRKRNVAQVEKLFAALFADVDAVAAGIVAFAERTDKLALGIEDNNGIHRGTIGMESLMLDVDKAVVVDGDAVRRFPANVAGKLAPVMDALVAIVAVADDGVLGPAFVAGAENGRGRAADQRRCAGRCRLLEKIASSHGRGTPWVGLWGTVRNLRPGGTISKGFTRRPSAAHFSDSGRTSRRAFPCL